MPLSAEFAPQMTLFGPAPTATVATAAGSTRLPAPEPAPVAAFERRADCARSAAGWWPTCTAATGAATARSTRG